MNFNSHAHVERDTRPHWKQKDIRISTHTLTWSVTGETYEQFVEKFISTHTLTWSVTSSGVALYSLSKISTHTLTWSVTIERGYGNKIVFDFNSHAHVERDDSAYGGKADVGDFNSHAHVERDAFHSS